MLLYKDEQEFLSRHRFVIDKLLKRRIEEYKNKVIDEEDDEKRDKLRRWTKELQFCQAILQKIDKEPPKEDLTGV